MQTPIKLRVTLLCLSVLIANLADVCGAASFSNSVPTALPIFAGDPPHDEIVSKMCNGADFSAPWMVAQYQKIHPGSTTIRLHRKAWEMALIQHIVETDGVCKPGKRGLGFAVGGEFLPSLFASYGCSIHATDFPLDKQVATDNAWVSTNQHASLGIYQERFLPKDKFEKLVTYEGVDMNDCEASSVISKGEPFDFMWSTCSVEHVGSVNLGKRFIINAAFRLNYGGVAVHTMEFSLSNDNTNSGHRFGGTSIWRRRDVIELSRDLCKLGFDVAPLHFEMGTTASDLQVALPPFNANKDEHHVKIFLQGNILTSFAIVFRRPVGHSPRVAHSCYSRAYHNDDSA